VLLAGYVLLFLTVGQRTVLGLVLLAASGLLGVGWAATQAMVADVVPRERHEAGYASLRVANNLGVTPGPPVGGLLLLLASWSALFLGVSIGAALVSLLALRVLPRRGLYAPEEKPERASFAVIRRDQVFLLSSCSRRRSRTWSTSRTRACSRSRSSTRTGWRRQVRASAPPIRFVGRPALVAAAAGAATAAAVHGDQHNHGHCQNHSSDPQHSPRK
jgi:MFS family permease